MVGAVPLVARRCDTALEMPTARLLSGGRLCGRVPGVEVRREGVDRHAERGRDGFVDAAVALCVEGRMGPGVASGVVIRQLTVLSHAVSLDGGAAQGIDRSLDSLPGLRMLGLGVGRTELRRVRIDPRSWERGEGGG